MIAAGKLLKLEPGPEAFEQGVKSRQRPDKAGDSADFCGSGGWPARAIEWVVFERVDEVLHEALAGGNPRSRREVRAAASARYGGTTNPADLNLDVNVPAA